MPNDVALFFCVEIVIAITYLHSNNIVFRDLRPESILIAQDGHIKLGDFTFAKNLDPMYQNGKTFTICGSLEYLAPEMVQQKKEGYGLQIDWWALGIIIYELLSGYQPFTDEDP